MQILDHGVEIEPLEFLGVVERLAHRIGQLGIPMQNLQVQLLRPPVAVPVSAGRERAFARALVVSLCVHVSLRSVSAMNSVSPPWEALARTIRSLLIRSNRIAC